MEISERNFNIQTPENVQQEFRVILHFHQQQLLIAPAKSAISPRFSILYIMSQSSCASSSVYSAQPPSAISSFEDIDLFMRIDSASQQITIPIISIPKQQPELYEFNGKDFIAMEEPMRQQEDSSGDLRPPIQQEARRLRQERISWVQHVQQEPRSRWSLDTLERGEAIEMENTQSGGRRRLSEGLRRFEWFRWTLAIWLAWFFGFIRNFWR